MMKQQLLKLYESRQQDFKSVKSQFPNDTLAGPFLMSPSDKYSNQKHPLLIIGQETNGWRDNVDNLARMIDCYEEFNVGIDYYSSPFWNITRKLEAALGNDKHSCAWTNISKFDVNSKRASGVYEKAISSLDDILVSEIKITTPSVCMFFTGPAFDDRVKRIFKGVEFIPLTGWTTAQFCQLKHPDLPRQTFRSYHPKSLRLRKLEKKFIDFFSSINN